MPKKNSHPSNNQSDVSEEKTVVINQEEYLFVSPLTGRGQSGAAGFYKKVAGGDQTQYLIKEDDLATCLQEGCAQFVMPYLPVGYENAINLATVESMNGVVVTKQQKLDGYTPWDMIILGHKRNPKTLLSQEKSNMKKITTHIEQLNNSAKSDLATAIFASAFVGDESLHIGQFMAKTNDNGNVEHITRIDLGARERHAMKRRKTGDFKHQTSKAYASSGQFGKKYMDYLLVDPDVRAKYLQLWMHSLFVGNQFNESSVNAFQEAIGKIPDQTKQETLTNIYRIYAKGLSKKPNEITEETVSKLIKKIVTDRIFNMRNEAIKEIQLLINTCSQILTMSPDHKSSLEKLIKPENPEDYSINPNDLFELTNEMTARLSSANKGEKEQLYSLLGHMRAAIEFNEHALENQALINHIAKIQSHISITTLLDQIAKALSPTFFVNLSNTEQLGTARQFASIANNIKSSPPQSKPELKIYLDNLKAIIHDKSPSSQKALLGLLDKHLTNYVKVCEEQQQENRPQVNI